MMAVDSKQGTTPNQPPVGNVVAGSSSSSPAPANGAAATNGQAKRRKRPSSLLAVASSLPSVENSLEEFIARANQTLVDASTWENLEKTAREENDKQREADALRWKAAETQLRESEVRESSLRNQLDGLQGRLAEAEARAAVAGTSSSDNLISDLKIQIQRADQRLRDAEDRATHLAHELVSAKTSANARPSVEIGDPDREAAEERIRIAEAKAAKALAAAKAASAGLRVSQADIAAIESGLIVTDSLDTPKRTPWVAIFIAFAGGLAIMFAVYKFGFSKTDKVDDKASTPPAATATQPEAVPAPTPAPTKPIVTPIDEPATAPAKTEPTEPTAPDKAAAAPAAPDKAAEPEIVVDTPAPVVEKTVAKKTPAPAPAKHHVATPAPAPVKHTAPAPAKEPKPAGGLADPFGGAPAAAPAKKKTTTKAPAEKKPAGGIADPF
jgi:hypothetical protein